MILNERALHLVLILAEELHFGRAAKRLHVSQPALSGAVRSLEHDLGVPLFRRTSRHVELTDAGQVFVTEARRLVADTERALALIRGSSAEILGPLTIGYPASFDHRWLCSLIAAARNDDRLKIELQFISADGEELLQRLAHRTLHVAFLSGRTCRPDLVSVTLFRDAFRMAYRPPARPAVEHIDQLADEPVVWLRREIDPGHYDTFLSSCALQGYHPNIVHHAGTFYECLEFARAGLGVTFLPNFLQLDEANSAVATSRLPERALYAEYSLVYNREGYPREVERFIRFAQNQAFRRRTSVRPPNLPD